MTNRPPAIRPAYSNWPRYNRAIRDVVAGLTADQLALRPAPERWPIWATIGHLACQRVFWLCDFAGEPGAASSPFPNAGFDCPGDDDLEHVWSADALAAALDATFEIVEGCLDRWTLDMLDPEIRPPGDGRVYSRGSIIQRVFAHDISHAAELNEVLGRDGLSQINFWD
jgi:DinB superfamily